jgi:hypothetical protein
LYFDIPEIGRQRRPQFRARELTVEACHGEINEGIEHTRAAGPLLAVLEMLLI